MTVFEGYTFQYKDKIQNFALAQELADRICEGFEIASPKIHVCGYGNFLRYTVDRRGGDIPKLFLNEEGLNIGTLAHELAHHVEVMKTGNDTHSDRHKDLTKLIQDKFREILKEE